MSILKQYDTPAFQQDFPDDPVKQAEMNRLWSANVNRWVEASQVGDVFDLDNYGPRPAFYNPLVTDQPDSATTASITWNAFPGRFAALFPNDQASYMQWGDTGQGIPDPAVDLCSGDAIPPAKQRPYGPTGPRGWQDEYCEWAVTRDESGTVTRVDFTCENPEYWLTLWACDPQAVLAEYRSIVHPDVAMEDLQLKDASGEPVKDPTTGGYCYDPLNIWNSGPVASPEGGGAVHLTSSPNTLGAEFDLAAASSMPRVKNGQVLTSATGLVCCGLYGRIGRHSDPTIGQNVNALANSPRFQGARVTLTNPPGLYIQTPDWSTFTTPDGSDPSTYWTVKRGRVKQGDDLIDRILHATYEVPAAKPFSVGDIKIGGQAIKYGGQITSTITMALLGTVFATGGASQTPVSCTVPKQSLIPSASAMQDLTVFTAYRDREQAQNEIPLSIPILALPVQAGRSFDSVAVPVNLNEIPNDLIQDPGSATIDVTGGGGVTVKVTGARTIDGVVVLVASIGVAPDAAPGDRGIVVTIPGFPTSSQPAIGLLTVTPPADAPQAGRVIAARPSHRGGRA